MMLVLLGVVVVVAAMGLTAADENETTMVPSKIKDPTKVRALSPLGPFLVPRLMKPTWLSSPSKPVLGSSVGRRRVERGCFGIFFLSAALSIPQAEPVHVRYSSGRVFDDRASVR